MAKIIDALKKGNPDFNDIFKNLDIRYMTDSGNAVALLKSKYEPALKLDLTELNESKLALDKFMKSNQAFFLELLKLHRKTTNPTKMLEEIKDAIERQDMTEIRLLLLEWIFLTGNQRMFRLDDPQ
jgi:hypothetical protein